MKFKLTIIISFICFNYGATVSSGIYLYRLAVGNSFTSGKMCYVK